MRRERDTREKRARDDQGGRLEIDMKREREKET